MSSETKHLMKWVAAIMLIGIFFVLLYYSFADEHAIAHFWRAYKVHINEKHPEGCFFI